MIPQNNFSPPSSPQSTSPNTLRIKTISPTKTPGPTSTLLVKQPTTSTKQPINLSTLLPLQNQQALLKNQQACTLERSISPLGNHSFRSPPTSCHNSPIAQFKDDTAFKSPIPSTPKKASHPATEPYIDFFNSIHRPDLTDIIFFLENTIGASFALSGSSAMMLHAYRLGLHRELHRPPNDLDIRIMPEVKAALEASLLENKYQVAAKIKTSTLNEMKNDAQSHYFTLVAKENIYSALKVDVLSQPRFGTIENLVFFHGIPLMPLTALITAKIASLQVFKEELSDLTPNSLLYQANMQNVASTEQDIAFLNKMKAKEVDSTADSSKPFAKRKWTVPLTAANHSQNSR